MLHALTLLFRSGLRAPTQRAETALALPLLREEIAAAARGVQQTRRATAILAAQGAAEKKRLDQVEGRRNDIEERAISAMAAGQDGLAREAAGVLLNLEREAESLRASVDVYATEESRLRAELLESEARLRALDRGSRVAEARALGARMVGVHTPVASGLEGAEGRLLALQERQDLDQATMMAARALTNEGQAEAVREKLAGAGFGKALTPSVDDVLARLRAKAMEAHATKGGTHTPHEPTEGATAPTPATETSALA